MEKGKYFITPTKTVDEVAAINIIGATHAASAFTSGTSFTSSCSKVHAA